MHRIAVLSILAASVAVATVWPQNYPAKPVAPPAASAPATCPWLTEGSAAAALGGSVRVTLDVTDSTHGTCTFTRKQAPLAELRVVIGLPNVPACPSGSPKVVGVGTQANRCRLPLSNDAKAEMIAARVRSLNFAVTFSGDAPVVSTPLDYRPAIGIDQIAEQVAGNLF